MSKTVQNTRDFRTTFKREYQMTHYKKACYPLFAYTKFRDILEAGDTVAWDYDADSVAGDLGSDDAYTIRKKTTSQETLTINRKPFDSFIIPKTEKIQDHLPTQKKWSQKAVNTIITKMDGDILYDLTAGAGNTLDAGDFGGSAGEPIDVTTGNVAQIFAKSRTILVNNNVVYNQNKLFRNDVKLDTEERFPAAAISAELEEKLNLAIGFKDTSAADSILKEGFSDTFSRLFKFNTAVTTSLPFEFRLTYTSTPADASVLKIGSGSATIGTGTAVEFLWETGTITDAPGKVKAETSATASVEHLVNLINDPYNGVTGESEPFVKANLSVAQERLLNNITAVDNEDGSCVITIKGYGKRTVSQDDTNGTIDREAVINIFGVSQSIGLVIQKQPELLQSAGELISTSASGGVIGKHFVGYTLYGDKMFASMTPQVIKVKVAASNFQQPASAYN